MFLAWCCPSVFTLLPGLITKTIRANHNGASPDLFCTLSTKDGKWQRRRNFWQHRTVGVSQSDWCYSVGVTNPCFKHFQAHLWQTVSANRNVSSLYMCLRSVQRVKVSEVQNVLATQTRLVLLSATGVTRLVLPIRVSSTSRHMFDQMFQPITTVPFGMGFLRSAGKAGSKCWQHRTDWCYSVGLVLLGWCYQSVIQALAGPCMRNRLSQAQLFLSICVFYAL